MKLGLKLAVAMLVEALPPCCYEGSVLSCAQIWRVVKSLACRLGRLRLQRS